MAHEMVVGTQVVVQIPGSDRLGDGALDMVLAPGATTETIFESLNEKYETGLNTNDHKIIATLPGTNEGMPFGAQDDITPHVTHGTRLSIVPNHKLQMGC